jgi:ATP-dependent DNA helicase RecG
MSVFVQLSTLGFCNKIQKKLESLCSGSRLLDLFFHKPRYFINRHNFKTVKQAKEGELVSIKAMFQRVDSNRARWGRRKLVYKFTCFDIDGEYLEVIFFGKVYYKIKFGQQYIVCGKLTDKNKIIHPDKILHWRQADDLLPLEPVYPCCEGISSNFFISILKKLIGDLGNIQEWIPKPLAIKYEWPSWQIAINHLHFPSCIKDFCLARQRLAFDEMIAVYSVMRKMQSQMFCTKKITVKSAGKFLDIFIKRLGFELTNCQKSAIKKVLQMQNNEKKMMALLQGDVGSGKTVVIFAAALNAAECKMQSVLLVPTSVLAKQHFKKLSDLMPEVRVELVIGATPKRRRDKILQSVASGEVKIIIGTHALLEEGIVFLNLALLVIDEQHRFGADQRTKILKENKNADLLLVSATPIPRTMAQILFGSISYINLKQKPACRVKTQTSVIKTSKIEKLIARLKHMVKAGSRVFWVCSLVEENENLDRVSVDRRYNALKKDFCDEIDFIHGGLKEKIINEKIEKFRTGQIKIILATTVVEVGVDVPEADIIVIENAENFGLAQLHQLRGRVGRGDRKSFCILLYDESKLTDIAQKRLEILKNCQDGFLIAEEDFKLRGSGEIFGQKQSGFSEFKFINITKDRDLFELAARSAEHILKNKAYHEIEVLIKMFFPGNNYYL